MFQFAGKLDLSQPAPTNAKNRFTPRFRSAAYLARLSRSIGGFSKRGRSVESRMDSRWEKKMRLNCGDARVGAVELPTWTNNRLMTCKYGGANQAAVPTGHGKRRCDPLARSLVRNAHRDEGRGGWRVEGIPIYPMYLRGRPAHMRRAVATRAYIFNGCTLIALCLPIPHSTLHLHVHPHSLHPFRAAILLC